MGGMHVGYAAWGMQHVGYACGVCSMGGMRVGYGGSSDYVPYCTCIHHMHTPHAGNPDYMPYCHQHSQVYRCIVNMWLLKACCALVLHLNPCFISIVA